MKIFLILSIILFSINANASIPNMPSDIISEDIKEVYTYALLSKSAYKKKDVKTIYGWEEEKFIEGAGFRAEVYRNNNKKEVVIAFSGTDSLVDVVNDVFQFVSGFDPQYQAGLSMVMAYLIQEQNTGYQVILTGHSLGGGIAQYTAKVLGLKAYTFNPAPVKLSILKSTIVSQILTEPKPNIFNVVAIDKYNNFDVVSFSPGELFGLTKKIRVETCRMCALDRHGIQVMIDTMENSLKNNQKKVLSDKSPSIQRPENNQKKKDDHGDSPNNATTLGINSVTKGILNSKKPFDCDMFKFTLKTNGKLSLNIEGMPVFVQLTKESLKSGGGRTVAGGRNGLFSIKDHSVDKGTYYILVGPYDEKQPTGKYTLALKFSSN